MVRIAGVNIPDNKRVEIALTYIYGIGLTTSQKILKDLSISPDTRTKDSVPRPILVLFEVTLVRLWVADVRRQIARHNTL